MAATTDFVTAQKVNRRNTMVLLVGLTALAALVGYVIGWLLESEASNAVPMFSQGGVAAAGLMALVSVGWSTLSLAFGDKMVLAMANAKQIDKADAPQLYNVVEEMAIAAGVPKPRVAVIETPALNACATGMRPEDATIAPTRGLLQRLSRDELQGVVGHEMGHIANWDIRYATAVGIMVGLIALVSDVILRSLRWGSFSRSRRSEERGGGGGVVALVLIVLLIVFAILAPIASKLVQLAISRQREYLADATSVRLTRDPQGLISALAKLENSQVPMEGANRATQHLFIVNPLRNFSVDAGALFATHPALSLRIARLRNLGGTAPAGN